MSFLKKLLGLTPSIQYFADVRLNEMKAEQEMKKYYKPVIRLIYKGDKVCPENTVSYYLTIQEQEAFLKDFNMSMEAVLAVCNVSSKDIKRIAEDAIIAFNISEFDTHYLIGSQKNNPKPSIIPYDHRIHKLLYSLTSRYIQERHSNLIEELKTKKQLKLNK
jgi:hypothetical protein